MGLIGFIHYTVNAFIDKEWGMGDESHLLYILTPITFPKLSDLYKRLLPGIHVPFVEGIVDVDRIFASKIPS
ncbi:hypothetical protein R9C00_17700 [Flammeovirgaceae bacterium SG7u.111]|nr:hypothetical protein [Flammeovirgaceae bacterium SG7u.132]WPO33538.1 hypothetical protein R9C00_17700 [Flammeovirgaceae bacterium SG7u.111]